MNFPAIETYIFPWISHCPVRKPGGYGAWEITTSTKNGEITTSNWVITLIIHYPPVISHWRYLLLPHPFICGPHGVAAVGAAIWQVARLPEFCVGALGMKHGFLIGKRWPITMKIAISLGNDEQNWELLPATNGSDTSKGRDSDYIVSILYYNAL